MAKPKKIWKKPELIVSILDWEETAAMSGSGEKEQSNTKDNKSFVVNGSQDRYTGRKSPVGHLMRSGHS